MQVLFPLTFTVISYFGISNFKWLLLTFSVRKATHLLSLTSIMLSKFQIYLPKSFSQWQAHSMVMVRIAVTIL